jgi:hypothetical protein
MPTVMITLPEHDILTKYCSIWSTKISEAAEKAKVKLILLSRTKANKKDVLGRMRKLQPELVIFNGHGNQFCVAGHDDEPILVQGENVMPAKIIFARACDAAHSLGPSLVADKVSTFIGYNEPFFLRMDEQDIQKELSNPVAKLYLEPSNAVPIALIKGSTAEEANNKGIKEYKNIVRRLLLEGPKSEYYQEIKYLYWNMSHQVCLGDGNAKM